MTKYSVGSSDDPDPNDENASCTMCGATEDLSKAEVAGAKVVVCPSCKNSDDVSENQSDENQDSTQSTREDLEDAAQTSTETSGYTITNPDSSWVEEDRPDYGNTETPYLVPNYVNVIEEALYESDITKEDISEETGLHVETVEAVIDGNAVSAGVGRRAIGAIESYLDIQLQEEI